MRIYCTCKQKRKLYFVFTDIFGIMEEEYMENTHFQNLDIAMLVFSYILLSPKNNAELTWLHHQLHYRIIIQ